MKIAIVGAGISGLTAAFLLQRQHDVTVFEANDYIGGHTNTVLVDDEGVCRAIDTGFIVFNDWTYPNFIRLIEKLGVPSQPSTMSFSVRCEKSGLEYNGTSLNSLFCQRSNLLRPAFLKMVRDIVRFGRDAEKLLTSVDEEVTVGEYVASKAYSRGFIDHYLVPMGSAIWSAPPATFLTFPIRFVVEFYHNHGMLSINHRPQWQVVKGGSFCYVDALTNTFRDRIHLEHPVQQVHRHEGRVLLTTAGQTLQFDEVILACHADQSLRMVCDADQTERSILAAFPYQRNEAVLHTDTRVMPRKKLGWASWNYHLTEHTNEAKLTYNMNMLQSIDSKTTYCVTLNHAAAIEPAKIIKTFVYHHPVYTTGRAAAQRRHGELIRRAGISYCGAYWGYGFHEDGVNSGMAVAKAFGESL